MIESREDVLIEMIYIIAKAQTGMDLSVLALREFNDAVKVWHQRMQDGELPEEPFDEGVQIRITLDIKPVGITLTEDNIREDVLNGKHVTYTLKKGERTTVNSITVSRDGVVFNIATDSERWTLNVLPNEVELTKETE